MEDMAMDYLLTLTQPDVEKQTIFKTEDSSIN